MSIIQLVYTEKDKCRICYTCVRECPAKAIRIINGQAEIILERCIACGNCVKVCSQGAKKYIRYESEVLDLLEKDKNVIACIAPSFPAEFAEIKNYRLVVGMLKKLGFSKVVEVGFGADIIAKEYDKLLGSTKKTVISSDCPAIVNYIVQYQPELIENLATIVSPMVAITRIVRKKYGENIKVVFIGPCIAKKYESQEPDFVLTFNELRNILDLKNININNIEPAEFDAPFAGAGSIFPISRGMSITMQKTEKIGESDFLACDGKKNFSSAIEEYLNGNIDVHYMELLCCEGGCILGAGMTEKGKRYNKRANVKEYVDNKVAKLDKDNFKKEMEEFSALDYSRSFEIKDRRIKLPSKEEIDEVLKSLGKFLPSDHLNCGACGYSTCEEHAIAIIGGLAEQEMCLPYSIEKLHKSLEDVNITNEKLAFAKQALKQSEKLASMGQLSAGIAHELNNPLGVITMYSNLVKEDVEPNSQIYKDLELIAEEAERCKKIVGGLLNFARKNQVKLLKTNIYKLLKHSLETLIIPENISSFIENNAVTKYVDLDYDQMIQVLNNIEKNAIEAMPDGGVLEMNISETDFYLVIEIKDNGSGISNENLEKIFTPFFTTKSLGKGTGLGLPLVYGIIKMHKGKIEVVSNDNPLNGKTGTSFFISLPKKN